MSETKRDRAAPSDPAAAARAFADRGTTTSNRIAALVADAGLSCRFQSILSASGEPYAELAFLSADIGDRVHGEAAILRTARWAELLRAAATFRARAVTEFSAAMGSSSKTLLYLPYYCALSEVEAIGPPLGDLLQQHRLPPTRVICEVETPDDPSVATSVAKRLLWLHAVGVRVAVRVSSSLEAAAASLRTLSPDLVHILCPPESLDDRERYKALLAQARAAGASAVMGGLDTPEAALAAEGLEVPLLYGASVAPPRFLC
ncbi:MAG: EAL domain-containing protein [Polyangiaceae bacterium]|jgi:EAL domain-containing protein (putative c-di-GMP-specific phosphodiesterase class I)|nr:EAL domain-containing protein [Polyangiaceae bacterium]MBK8940709.1 EAL domain-containing protein [Polyangiaceae bacterium]